MHAPETEALLDEIGLRPGSQAIDIGCGPLGVLDLLSVRVGGAGSVIGLDQSSQMLEGARQTVRERGLGNVTLVQALGEGTSREEGSFDLVHTRLVLINVPNPEDLVAEMVRIARPGGWVVIQDYDWIPLACSPALPAWDRLASGIRAVWEDRGCDVGIGRRLHGMVHAAGLTDLGVRAQQRVWRHGDVFHGFAMWVAVMLRERILDVCDIAPAELDSCIAEVRTHLAPPGTISLHPLHVQVWGRKPTDS